MNRCARLAFAVVLCAGLSAPAAGQTPLLVWAGAGPSIPLGDFGDRADTGWMAGAGLLAIIGQSGLWAGVEGTLGRNSYKGYGGNHELMGGGGMVGYTLAQGARAQPYVFGNVGLLSLKTSSGGPSGDSTSGLSMGAGAGVTYNLTESASLFASGRYLTADIEDNRLNMVPVTVGLTYILGGPRSAASMR
jgi:hypothetical protein